MPGRRDDLQVECVTSGTALAALRPEWDALWAAQPEATPFQHSAWLCAWWEIFGGGDLRVHTFRHGGRLCAVAPFYVARTCSGGELRLLGAGVSDYLDVLAASPTLAPVVAAIEAMLERTQEEWAACAFDHLRPGSPLLTLAFPAGTVETRHANEPCPALFLPGAREDLSAAIGSRMTRNIRHQWQRAERLGRVAVRHEQPDTLDATLEALFQLHGQRWKSKGSAGVLADGRVRDFHRMAARGLLSAGVLRLHSLWIGSRLAAVYYGFHTATRDYYYISGFDPAFAAIGAGSLAIASAIDRAIAERSSAFDFLGGREPYKYRWGAVDRVRFSRHVHRRGGQESIE